MPEHRSMQDSARMLDRVVETTIAAIQSPNMPIYEQFDFFRALHRMSDKACTR